MKTKSGKPAFSSVKKSKLSFYFDLVLLKILQKRFPSGLYWANFDNKNTEVEIRFEKYFDYYKK